MMWPVARGEAVAQSHQWPLGRSREVLLWDGADVEQSWCTTNPTEWGRSIKQSAVGHQSFVLEVQNELC